MEYIYINKPWRETHTGAEYEQEEIRGSRGEYKRIYKIKSSSRERDKKLWLQKKTEEKVKLKMSINEGKHAIFPLLAVSIVESAVIRVFDQPHLLGT